MMVTTLFAAAETEVFHQFGRFQTLTEWWQWFMLVAAAVAILAFVIVMYRKDSAELPRGLAWGMCLLRCVVFLGILFFYLDLEKREERKLIRNSRTAVLIDTSLSMGIQDAASSGGSPGERRRIDAVIEELADRPLIEQLRQQHDVTIYKFDQQSAPVELASFPRVAREAEVDASTGGNREARVREARVIAGAGAALMALSLIALVVSMVFGSQPSRRTVAAGEERDGSWPVLVSLVSLIGGLIVLGVAMLRNPDLAWREIAGIDPVAVQRDEREADIETAETPLPRVNWNEQLTPRGVETRIGDAIRFVMNKEQGGPIAGVILVTDGGNNAGADLPEIIAASRGAGVPIHAVGMGSQERATNARIVDLEAPPRVFPGDAFPITGYLQTFNLPGRTLRVELVSSPESAAAPGVQPVTEETREVNVGADGELLPLRFEITPQEAGQRTYQLRVVPPAQDTDERDNARSATVQIIDRKSRVLLFAGAATREFQFLRNLLFRDSETTVDVFLQSGTPGISQEADELLFEFPGLPDELFAYDAIVAIDPDWTQVNAAQAELIEQWVAEKAGGLILIAGNVDTPKLAGSRGGDGGLETIRGLYPVVFFGRGSATLSLSRTASETPWPLRFTRDGQEAEFLRLDEDPIESERIWTSYPGTFGYFAVKDPKPGAKVYARFSDPATAIDGELPVYLAGQFYGSGRVLFQGSGEMWRIREADDAYFEKYYTKLIRWVSQGRLLRDSSRGVLLVDKERGFVGETISVQAILTDSQHQPLTAGEVTAVLIDPDGKRSNLVLRRIDDAARPGMYAAQFAMRVEGDYRLELPLPGSGQAEMLTREVRSRIPALESERPERNDAFLKDLAEKTGGEYFIGFDAAMNRGSGRTPLPTLLEPQDQTTYLPGTPDKEFDRSLMTWLMAVICGALCLEWLLRRLNKLA